MELINFYIKQKRNIHSFIKAIPFFLFLGIILTAVLPWEGDFHPNSIMSKGEFLSILFYAYGIILSFVAAVIAIGLIISKAFEAIFSKLKFFNLSENSEFTISDALISLGLITLAASISFSIISLFVYKH